MNINQNPKLWVAPDAQKEHPPQNINKNPRSPGGWWSGGGTGGGMEGQAREGE